MFVCPRCEMGKFLKSLSVNRLVGRSLVVDKCPSNRSLLLIATIKFRKLYLYFDPLEKESFPLLIDINIGKVGDIFIGKLKAAADGFSPVVFLFALFLFPRMQFIREYRI